jgi:hypothetical protein
MCQIHRNSRDFWFIACVKTQAFNYSLMYNLELSALDTGDELFTNDVDTMAKNF